MVHAIFSVRSAHPHWKAFLMEAWDTAKLWKSAELLSCALRCLALCCERGAALLLRGFMLLLRHGELLTARRCALSLPCVRPER